MNGVLFELSRAFLVGTMLLQTAVHAKRESEFSYHVEMNIAYDSCLSMVFRDIWSNLYCSSVHEQYYIRFYLPRISKSIEFIRDIGKNVHWCL